MRVVLVVLAVGWPCMGSGAAPPGIQPWGFDLAGRDLGVAPGDDFYAYANGDYVRQLTIPADRSRYGVVDTLQSLTDARIHALLQGAAQTPGATGDVARLGAFWRAYMNEGQAEALGTRPISPALQAVRAATTRSAISALMGQAVRSLGSGFFDLDIEVDTARPDHYAVYVDQAGLGLPDRDDYLDPALAPRMAAYKVYVARLLALIGWPDAERQADAIAAVETAIAQASWSRSEMRASTAVYNPMSISELSSMAPGFDWKAYFSAAGLGAPSRVIVEQKGAVAAISKIVAATPIETLQAWEAFSIADAAAPLLSAPFVRAAFDFHGRALGGETDAPPRWRQAVQTLNACMGDAVGRLYVDAYFPGSSKTAVAAIVANVRRALDARLSRSAWMSEPTRERAREKLSKLRARVAYPRAWRSYSGLRIAADDLVGDVERATAWAWARKLDRLGHPVDQGEWEKPPQTVTAYYDLDRNEMMLMAAILQPPFFDARADPAVNYGAIGAVVGHEMTHGYDDLGRRFDGEGRLADWWTPGDDERFRRLAAQLAAQYSALQPLPGVHVKGGQVLGEAIADLGGLTLALDAYELSLAGRPAPVLDGLSGEQRVFLGWAQIWRSAIRPEALRRQIASDVHAPDVDRVNQVVPDIDGWYGAWRVGPGQALYVPPGKRVRIW